MARLPKKGVDYFPHYVGSRDGKMLYILKSKFGNNGYAFWYQLLELLGSEKSLCYEADNQANWLYLVATTGVDDDLAEEILDMLAELEAIDRDLWRKRRVIWCQEFVDQLEPIYKKRRLQAPQKPVLYSDKIKDVDLEEDVSPSVGVVKGENYIPTETNKDGDLMTRDKVPEVKFNVSPPETGSNESLTTEERDKGICKEYPFVEAPMIDVFSKWLLYKEGRGQKYKTNASVKTCYEKLQSYSGGDPNVANDIIENSIGMNYSGFFPIKHNTTYDHRQKMDYLTNSNATKIGVNTSTI